MRKGQLAALSVAVTLAAVASRVSAAPTPKQQVGQALLGALRDADDVRALTLMEQSPDVNVKDDTGATPLMWAAQHNNTDFVVRLLKAGAKPSMASENGMTPLQIAVANQSEEIARSLLDNGAKVNVARDNGETPLMTAARTGQLAVMKLLIEHGADVNAHETAFNQTALMWSAGYPQQTKLLIAHGADVRARSKAWDVTNTIYAPVVITIGFTGIPWDHSGEYVSKKGGQSALFFAVQKNDLESVQALLDAGVDVNDPAADGSTALVLALYKWGNREFAPRIDADGRRRGPPPFDPNLPIAHLLLDHGARVNVADAAGYTPLHGAVLSAVSESRLQPQFTLGLNDKSDQSPPAALAEVLRLVKRLLDLNADPNAATRYPTPGPITEIRINPAPPGSSPLHIAALAGNTEIMQVLLAKGGDPGLLRKDGHSPLSVAVQFDDLPMVTLLVDQGASVKQVYSPTDPLGDPEKPVARPRSRQTILHIAAASLAFKVVDFLVAHGAPLDLKNDMGETPLALADAQERFRFAIEKESLQLGRIFGDPEHPQPPPVRDTETTDALKKQMKTRVGASIPPAATASLNGR